jgi:toxin HigB-1
MEARGHLRPGTPSKVFCHGHRLPDSYKPRLTYYANRNTMNVMIESFRCKDTEALYKGASPKRFRAIEVVATRKLQMIEAAHELNDLRSPPGNRLEPLYGDRTDQHSIRINGQWRICFFWTSDGATEVEIVDYH